MHQNLDLPKYNRGPHRSVDPTLVCPENEWRRLSSVHPSRTEKETSSEKERSTMDLQSKAIKSTWLNTTESRVKEKAEMTKEVQTRIKQAEKDLEEAGVELRHEEMGKIIARAKDIVFNRREEIREYHGAMLLSEGMTFWEAQKKEKDAIRKVREKYDHAMEDAILRQAQQDTETEREHLRQQRRDNKAYNEQLQKQIHHAGTDFDYIHKQADHVKRHVDQLREEDHQERVQEQAKADMRRDHLDNLAMQKRCQDEENAKQALRNTIHREYIQEKVKRVKKTANFYHNKIHARHRDRPALFAQAAEVAVRRDKHIEESFQRAQIEKEEAYQKKEQQKAEKREQFITDGVEDRKRSEKVREDRHVWETEIKSTFETMYAKWRQAHDKKVADQEANTRKVRGELEIYWATQVYPHTAPVAYRKERAAQVQKKEDQHAAHQEKAQHYIDKVIEERQGLGRDLRPLEYSRKELLKPLSLRKIRKQSVLV